MPQPRLPQSVIFADDDKDIRTVLRNVLERPYRAVFQAANGVEAVAYAQSVIADLVLLDVKMSRMSGIEACAQIRKLPGYANVPIIMLTAYDGTYERRNAARAGATDFMNKPISTNELLNRIKPCLPELRAR